MGPSSSVVAASPSLQDMVIITINNPSRVTRGFHSLFPKSQCHKAGLPVLLLYVFSSLSPRGCPGPSGTECGPDTAGPQGATLTWAPVGSAEPPSPQHEPPGTSSPLRGPEQRPCQGWWVGVGVGVGRWPPR